MSQNDDSVKKIEAVTAVVTSLAALFKAVGDSGLLNSLPNIPVKTMGGKVFWNDLAQSNGWRLQQNMITHHCRILDPNNVRRAWGFSEDSLRDQLAKLV